jgi:hypothetical protein
MQDYLNYWVPASKLKKGERLKTPDGTLAIADGGTTPKQHGGWMWDLTVPGIGDHDFYVVAQPADTSRTHSHDEGGTPVLVHNINGCEDVQNLVNGVQARARLAAAAQSNVERGQVLSGALDTRTGAITYAQNASSIPDPLHPDCRPRSTPSKAREHYSKVFPERTVRSMPSTKVYTSGQVLLSATS